MKDSKMMKRTRSVKEVGTSSAEDLRGDKSVKRRKTKVSAEGTKAREAKPFQKSRKQAKPEEDITAVKKKTLKGERRKDEDMSELKLMKTIKKKSKARAEKDVRVSKRKNKKAEAKKVSKKRFMDVKLADEDEHVEEDGKEVKFVVQGGGKEKERKTDKKRKGKLAGNVEEDEESAGGGKKGTVIYIGHIPHGFFEEEMRDYFGQYGEVKHVKVSRSKKTGRSKGYGFVEFASGEVAEVVAESMNGYLMFGQILEVQVVSPEKVHEQLFAGTEKKFRNVPWRTIHRNQLNRPRSDEELEVLQKRLVEREKKRRNRLSSMGIEYDFPGYEADVESPGSKKGKKDEAGEREAGARPSKARKKKATVEGEVAVKATAQAKSGTNKSVRKTVGDDKKQGVVSGLTAGKRQKKETKVVRDVEQESEQKENVKEQKENVKEQKENVKEQRENVKEQKEKVKEQKENVKGRKEKVKEQKENVRERKKKTGKVDYKLGKKTSK